MIRIDSYLNKEKNPVENGQEMAKIVELIMHNGELEGRDGGAEAGDDSRERSGGFLLWCSARSTSHPHPRDLREIDEAEADWARGPNKST